MKIQILSDLHLEFEDFDLESDNADVVVLAGDIHIGDKGIKWAIDNIRNKPVIYILGNHEYYKQTYPKLGRKIKSLTEGTNVYFLENENMLIDGVMFYGCTLWTDFNLFGNPRVAGYECQQKMTDFNKIRKEPNYSKIRSLDVAIINRQSTHWLQKVFENIKCSKNVVITHHAPSALSTGWGQSKFTLTPKVMPNSENAIPEEGYIVTVRKMQYIHIPVPFEAPRPKHIKDFISVMNAFKGKKVWVHCVVNYRVSAFLFLYMRFVKNATIEEASKVILKSWKPNDVWASFMEMSKDEISL